MSDLLGIGTSGLIAAQKSLDTVSHNISNANSPGYSRQATMLSARNAVQIGSSFTGAGVEVQGTRRIVDQFLTTSLYNQQSIYSEYESFSQVINQLDNIFSDPSTGLTNVMNAFFNAMQDANNNPDASSARQLLLSQAQVLENRFSDLSEQINSQFSNVNSQIHGCISEINSIAEQIAKVNVKIVNTGTNTFSEEPNDLLDFREQQILELSKYVTTSTIIQDNGAMNVFIGNGQALVMNGSVNRLAVQPNAIDSTRNDVVLVTNSSSEAIGSNLKGGQLGGLLALQSDVLIPSQNALGRIAISLAMTFNEQHKKGVDLNGNLGSNFFSDPNEISKTLNRTLKNRGNTGDAIFSVEIKSIVPSTSTTEIYSAASNIVNSGSLPPLTLGMLSLNDITVRATVIGDDPYSTSDANASAIAIAKAINTSSVSHHVTATPQQNVFCLGLFTPGAFVAGELVLNGVNVISTGADEVTLLQDINALSLQTGIMAFGDGVGNISLVANDGRNIQLTTNGNTAAATFTYLDTKGGVALDKVIRGNVLLFSQDVEMKVSGANPVGVGLATGTYPVRSSSLTTDNYELSFDGTFYTLRNLTYLTVVAQSTTPHFDIDGMKITLQAGTMVKNDTFVIQPTRNGAHDFELVINNQSLIALGFPVRVDANLENKGSAEISLVEITNTSGFPVSTSTMLGNAFKQNGILSPPIRIEFQSANRYRVFDVSLGEPGVQIGPDQIYNPMEASHQVFPIVGVVDNTLPGPNRTYIYDPGYRVILEGIPEAGDVFSIHYNNDASGDNRNGLRLANLQLEKTMSNQTATFQDSFALLVGEIGTKASQAKLGAQSSDNLLHFIESRRNEVSGVNLDEEAANLLRFEQAYQASAQVIVIAREIFEALMSILG